MENLRVESKSAKSSNHSPKQRKFLVKKITDTTVGIDWQCMILALVLLKDSYIAEQNLEQKLKHNHIMWALLN